MATRIYAGTDVEVTTDGYLNDASLWTIAIAEEIACEEGIILTREHFTFLDLLREWHYGREIITIRKINKSGVGNLKTFYTLFPGAALRKAARIAGIPKPENCV
jgi:TusE/DsrC/DsvC family sulfur relay protein